MNIKFGSNLSRARQILVGALVFLACPLAAEDSVDDAAREWSPLMIVDVEEQAWENDPLYGRIKTVFRGGAGNLKYIKYEPSWNTTISRRGGPNGEVGPHYHNFHEWAYLLSGDYVIYEAISPYQRNPIQYRWVEGTWMDRPPYSLHGGKWATGGARTQFPSSLLLFEEGGPNNVFPAPNEESRPVVDGPLAADVEDYRDIKFVHPLVVKTGSALEWEDDTQIAGRFVKWLSDDPVGGFRAQLIKIPPGWSHPEGAHKSYFERANRLRYMLYGDMEIQLLDDPAAEGEAYRLELTDFVHQPPGSLWAFGEGPVTEGGAVWLEITYAEGFERGGGPIEEPKVAE